jgi:hypothetical protein
MAPSDTAVAERPEVELLLCCARSRTDPGTSARINALLREGIEWGYLLRTAHRHRITPLLFWQLNATSPKAVPKSVLDQLRTHFHNNNIRNLYLTRELLGLLSAYEADKIPAVAYKGPTLAALAYGNLAFREFSDLDILVRRQDVLRGKKVLISKGYRPGYRMTDAQEAAFLRYGDQYLYTRDHDGSVVELHWGFASRAFSFLLNAERPWWRLERISLGGRTVLTFSPEDLLLILCVHGSMHLWERLAWVCDVAELTRARRKIDWNRLVEQATALGSRRALFLGLLLAESLLGASIPEKVSNLLHADAAAKMPAGHVREVLFQEDVGSERNFEVTQFQPFQLKVMERMRDKVRYCIRQATVPSYEDLELLPLPVYLFPAYRLLRPIRLVGKHGQRLFLGPKHFVSDR